MNERETGEKGCRQDDVAFLVQLGESLYGARWQTALAHDLARYGAPFDARTIRFWVSGDRKVPQSVWPILRLIGQDRRQRIVEHLAALEARILARSA